MEAGSGERSQIVFDADNTSRLGALRQPTNACTAHYSVLVVKQRRIGRWKSLRFCFTWYPHQPRNAVTARPGWSAPAGEATDEAQLSPHIGCARSGRGRPVVCLLR
jgi:hypothetical protein